MSAKLRRLLLLLLALLCAPGAAARADAITDGSVGPAVELGGDDFAIPAQLGSLRGRNLFHSFAQFGVVANGSATFTPEGASGGIDHVIVRVTGGEGSSINGRLVSTIGERSFVLVNPAGLAFGAGATLSVGGAFHASSANALRFDDGFELETTASPPGAVGGAGNPSILSFTSASPAAIDVRGQLRSAAGRDLSFVGGALDFQSATVSSAGGRLVIAALASSGSLHGVFDPAAAITLDGFARLARITAVDSLLSSTAITGLEEFYRLDLFGSELDGTLGSLYRVPVGQSPSDPSDLFLGFADLPIGRRAYFFHVFARPEGSGDVWVRADSLTLRDAEITALNPGGTAGDIDVDLGGDLVLERLSSEFETGLFTGGIQFGGTLEVSTASGPRTFLFRSGLGGSGPAGAIRIAADDIDLRGGAAISSTSSSSGAGGAISLEARGDVSISGRNPEGKARGLFSSAQGTGDAGDISIRARALRLDDGGAIIAQTNGNGDGGDIDIDVDTLAIRGGAQIDSSTSAEFLAPDAPAPSTGDGGNVSVRATQSVSVSGTASNGDPSRLSTFSQERTIGRAGSIGVVTPRLEVSEGGQISVRSSGAGESGQIALEVETLRLRDRAEISARADATGDAGEILIRARDAVELDRSAITTAAPNANGGNVRIEARERVVLLRSEITASVGGGTGGNISIDPRFVVLNHSQIVAQAGEGTGGSIAIQAEHFLSSVDSVVDASSRAGVDGTVVINAPDADMASELAALPEGYLDVSDLIAERCAARRDTKPGSFVFRGRGGLPDTPERRRAPRHRIDASERVPGAQLRGDRAAAIAYWDGSLATAADARGRAIAWLELAQLHEALGDLDAAAASLDQAESYVASLGEPNATAALAGVRARLLGRGGDPDAALRALDATRATASGATAAALELDRANLLAATGRRDQSEQAFDASERAAADAGASVTRALALADRASTTAEVESAARALRELPASDQSLFALLHAARQLGPSERLRAAALYAEAAARAEELDDPLASSWAWGWLGAEYERENRRAEALELTRRALGAAQRADAPESMYLWQWQVGRLALADGDLDTSLRAYRTANATLAALRLEFALHDAGQPAIAREYPVEPVVRGLVDVLLRVAATTEDPVDRSSLLAEARRRLEDLNASELQDYFEDECVATLRRAAPETVPGTVVVYPVILADRIELIVSLPGETRTFVVPVGAEQLASEVRRFREQVQDRTTQRYRVQAEQLYEWLVRPLEPDLERVRPATLIFVSTGSLRGLPLAALRDARSGQFLVEKYALAVAPGLTLTDPRPIDREHTRALKAGLAEASQGFPALANVPAELASVGALFPGPTLLDSEFVADRFQAALASESFGIVHVASHAEFGGDIQNAYIVLYDQKLGMTRLTEIVGLTQFRDQPLELLTLSACRTAAGDERSALGLAGVAVKAGARSTVASLWYIQDEASSKLIGQFYGELAKPGTSRAAALQSAQKTLLAERRFRHPFYWAPFILIGSWL